MYENQIFSLLGHNGAGKTTTINMLTGLYSPDVVSGHSAQHSRGTVYGHSIEKEIDKVRLSMGVCPQHDVLFDSLSVREHILFFAQLKGLSLAEAEVETNYLAGLFHLEHHLDNTSEELSGGQKRKLSVALAVCGGSKFVVLDEPTAGMDPLARRELWNLLGQLRQGRTILLTTHYMDEADTLGDRIAIMAKGQLVCCGSSQFLKLRYGSGYKLVVDYQPDSKAAQAQKLLTLIKSHVDTATISRSESADDTVVYVLPYDTTAQFAGLFQALDHDLWTLGIKTYGLSGSSLEDVFVRIGGEEQSPVGIGEDDPVYSEDGVDNCKQIDFNHGQKYNPYVLTQILGIAYRKLSQARNDFTTIPLLLLPIAASIGAAFIYTRKLISPIIFIDAVVANCVYAVGYIGVPGILAEFIVRERNDKLRNVLNVMGCDYRAYWIGTMIADYLLLLIPTVILWITWFVFDMQSYYASKNGLNFFVVMLFNAQIIAFAYFVSYLFNHPRSCITFTPTLLVGLDIAPSFVYSLFNQFLKAFNEEAGAPSQEVGSVIYWFTVVISPQGGIFACFLDIGENLTLLGVSNFPPYGASIAIMIIHTALFLGATMYIDKQSIATLTPIVSTRVVDENKLDSDVVVERHRVSDAQEFYLQQQSSLTSNTQQPVNGLLESGEKTTAAMTAQAPLRIDRLRRIYPPVKVGGESVIAVDDVSLALSEGEVFGLLGANGAGKTTLLSMLTRLTIPTSGDAYISQYSVVSNFRKVAKFLGVVTQNNALWDRLSVETHLYLFARLRGVSESMVPSMVEEVLMSLNLKPHRSKLAMQLSGGLKRKLCCAIALIGDPKVVLLDEPSAGLDPISRRQLWNVILRTMAHRSVLLTTHNMEEAEALCNRLGVMVRGQLCALGSKQHLKTKFGIGYKVTVKVNMPSIASSEAGVSPLIDAPKQSLTLATSTLNQQIHEVSMLLFSSFPSAKRIHDNGGLVTFEIPKDDLQMSRLFALLEDCKGRLGWIENYSIAQPTLEQVFIRIVNDTNATVNPEEAVRNEQNELKNEQDTINKVQVETTKKRRKGLRLTRAKCGCSDTWLRWVIIVCSALCLVLVIIGGVIGVVLKNAVGGAVSITIGIILFLIILVHVFLLCCLSCRNPVEEV
jgi:ATP-binding cassette subfamily A (ABC1) protein 3